MSRRRGWPTCWSWGAGEVVEVSFPLVAALAPTFTQLVSISPQEPLLSPWVLVELVPFSMAAMVPLRDKMATHHSLAVSSRPVEAAALAQLLTLHTQARPVLMADLVVVLRASAQVVLHPLVLASQSPGTMGALALALQILVAAAVAVLAQLEATLLAQPEVLAVQALPTASPGVR